MKAALMKKGQLRKLVREEIERLQKTEPSNKEINEIINEINSEMKGLNQYILEFVDRSKKQDKRLYKADLELLKENIERLKALVGLERDNG